MWLPAQIAKLTVYAPADGTLLTRNVEPGEFVQPGATALTLADLSDLTITVYVPEDRYGQINLGQQAKVTVDSFPGVTFQAVVSAARQKLDLGRAGGLRNREQLDYRPKARRTRQITMMAERDVAGV